jgi:hypothetical protein
MSVKIMHVIPLFLQELLTLPEHLSSPPVFSGVRVTRSLVLYVIGRQDDIPGMFTHTHNNNNFKALEIPITNVVSSTSRHERGNKLQL